MLIFCSREKKKIHLPVKLLLPGSSQTLAKFQPWQRLRERDGVSDSPLWGARPPDPRLQPPLSPCSFTSLFPCYYSCAPVGFHNRFAMIEVGLRASGQAGAWDLGAALNATARTGQAGRVLLKPPSSLQTQSEMVTVLLIMCITARSSGRYVPL